MIPMLTARAFMPKAIIVAGLPGSGKAHYLIAEAEQMGADWFDDFKYQAFRDDPNFMSARRLGELIASLWAERNCLIADIDFCDPVSLRQADVCIRELAPPETTIEHRFFAADHDQCITNVTARAQREKRDLVTELTNIKKYSTVYVIPTGCDPIPVWKGP